MEAPRKDPRRTRAVSTAKWSWMLAVALAACPPAVLAGEEAGASATAETAGYDPTDDGYQNMALIGVFPSRPIAALTFRMIVGTDYGVDDASCTWFGPGSPREHVYGSRTFRLGENDGRPLDRSQGVLLCHHFTHSYNGPGVGYGVRELSAVDETGADVPVRLCQLDWDNQYLPEPGPGDCRHACGDPDCDGGEPTASDARLVLKTSVGLHACDRSVCDPTGDGVVSIVDALATLQRALGIPRPLLCSAPKYGCFGS